MQTANTSQPASQPTTVAVLAEWPPATVDTSRCLLAKKVLRSQLSSGVSVIFDVGLSAYAGHWEGGQTQNWRTLASGAAYYHANGS